MRDCWCTIAPSMRAPAVAPGTGQSLSLRYRRAGIIQRYSTSVPLLKATPTTPARPVDQRWLSDAKRRIGKCITFGLDSKQLDEAGNILQQLAQDWTELMVGSEGYLTAPGRVGLDKQAVVWGEVASPSLCNTSFTMLIEQPLNRTRWYARWSTSISHQ
jgi:hypothetical protein